MFSLVSAATVFPNRLLPLTGFSLQSKKWDKGARVNGLQGEVGKSIMAVF